MTSESERLSEEVSRIAGTQEKPEKTAASVKDVGFANLNWGTKQKVDQKIINLFVARVCMALFVEAKVDVLSQMVPKGWRAHQWFKVNGKVDKGAQGCAAIWKIHNGRILINALRPIRIGVKHLAAKMLNRYIMIIDIEKDGLLVRVLVCHWPPARYKFLWKAFEGHVRLRVRAGADSHRWILFADFNMNFKVAQKRIGAAHGYGEGIIGALTGSKVELTEMEIIRVIKEKKWTDHVGIEGNLKVAA